MKEREHCGGRGGEGRRGERREKSSVCHVFFLGVFADRIHDIYRSSLPDSAEAVTVNLDANADLTHVRIIQRMDRYQGTFKCEQCETVFEVSVSKRKKRKIPSILNSFFSPLSSIYNR